MSTALIAEQAEFTPHSESFQGAHGIWIFQQTARRNRPPGPVSVTYREAAKECPFATTRAPISAIFNGWRRAATVRQVGRIRRG